jgi:protein phosphatase PTC7
LPPPRPPADLRLVSAVNYLPHPDKRATGGEDACFIGADGLSVGVADGVGGWADQGVDAGVYARTLMRHAQRAAEHLSAEHAAAAAAAAAAGGASGGGDAVAVAVAAPPSGEAASAPQTPPRADAASSDAARAAALEPLRVLLTAHAATRVPGSSTALILLLRGSTLHAANLGDSGFMILRGGRILFKSQAQTHSFNFPYQIGMGPSDPPSAAQLYVIGVQQGDVIVSATDGLWDNLHDGEIAALVRAELSAGRGPDAAAARVAAAAHVRGADPRADTPFSRGAMAARVAFRGGKMDDCTVLVSVVDGPGGGKEDAA